MKMEHLLDLIESYIMEVDPDSKNPELTNIFTWVHANNQMHCCYSIHDNWRNEALEAYERYCK